MGDSAFCILCRYFCSGACPVHSWIRKLAAFLCTSLVSLQKVEDGTLRSISFSLRYLGDSCSWCCFCVEVICGRVVCRNGGSWVVSVDVPMAAFICNFVPCVTFVSGNPLKF